ncbi:BZ3500_MvSof-1268-A1-R1_Chr3-1g06123 [Microbotryum saponariae]|uniref:BZ3500_MvSof-1268-A1-R1_Chr3-1g06123 protein n=1 Tax=Microbotryum saponariae TaxID=289078 RepID=A0A2X0NF06_9BASI|nr:BZ3500_MvSof-1268-A1-R1_Chr3-1g06123 [Microbotryum saponariae]SDA03986.1 BZ3501_MvSof-1269-A2-R1_Chr3-2g05808 [Microbotryum saponariae]
MFVPHSTYAWRVSRLPSLRADAQTERFDVLPDGEPHNGYILHLDGTGLFDLEIPGREGLNSKKRKSFDHALKTRWLKHATCAIWSPDRSIRYHQRDFVTLDTLHLFWRVPNLDQRYHSQDGSDLWPRLPFEVVIYLDQQHVEAEEKQLVCMRRIVELEAVIADLRMEADRNERQASHQNAIQSMRARTLRRNQELFLTAHPFDVRFEFGSVEDLWENSEFLASQSPYFSDLFAAGFLESATKSLDPERCSIPTRTVHVTKGSLEEYRAVFVWLRIGLVQFDDSPEGSHHQAAVQDPKPSHASSIYSLAHFLQIPELSALALKFCLEHLTPAKVAEELLREWCYLYKEVRQELIEYAVRNWSKVKTSPGMKDLCKTLGSDDLPFETQSVLLELMAKVATI